MSNCCYITCFSYGFIKCFSEFGFKTWSIADNELEELFQLSLRMFDTRLPPGVTVLSPFADDSSLNKVGVEVCDCIIFTSIVQTWKTIGICCCSSIYLKTLTGIQMICVLVQFNFLLKCLLSICFAT